MNIVKPKKIEDLIIGHLKGGAIETLDLVERIKHDRPNTTKQAVYAALLSLKAQEIIIIVKSEVSLHIAWINTMADFFELARNNYSDSSNMSLIGLGDKEKIKYYFQDAHKGDMYWTQAYYMLLEQLDHGEPVFIYNPHEWFLLARTENEKAVISQTVKKGHRLLLTAGHATYLDKYVRKYFDGHNSQYHILGKALFRDNNYYLNIFGDFLIEAWLDKKIEKNIEKIYQDVANWDESVTDEFKKILSEKARMRIVISRNRKKADRLKKTLKKGFAIKKS